MKIQITGDAKRVDIISALKIIVEQLEAKNDKDAKTINWRNHSLETKIIKTEDEFFNP